MIFPLKYHKIIRFFITAALLDDYDVFDAINQEIGTCPSGLASRAMFAMCMQKGEIYTKKPDEKRRQQIQKGRAKRDYYKRRKMVPT